MTVSWLLRVLFGTFVSSATNKLTQQSVAVDKVPQIDTYTQGIGRLYADGGPEDAFER